jgi:DNA recombination protein RmuC
VLNTARAVLKDVETRRQVHVIKECLARLAIEFNRFDERMRDLARHIKQAHEDVEKVQLTSSKISQRFAQIEGVELTEGEHGTPLRVVELRDENKA